MGCQLSFCDFSKSETKQNNPIFSTDNKHDQTELTDDEQHINNNNQCSFAVNDCNSLQRLINALSYYQTLKIDSNTNDMEF